MRRTASAIVAVALLGCSDGAESSSGSGSGFKMVDGPLVDQELKAGRVYGTSTIADDGGPSWGMGAFFGLRAGPSNCRAIQAGPCQVKTCVGEALDLTTRHAAGAMTVDVDGKLVSPAWGGMAYGANGKESLWVEPSTTVVTFAGDAVPAFSTTLQTPRRVLVTQPHFLDPWAACSTEAQRVPILRHEPLQLTWTGGSAGESVRVDLKWMSEKHSTELECFFDAGAGSGAVPKEALRYVPATDEADDVLWSMLGVASIAQAFAEPGGYTTRVSIESKADTPEGYSAISCAQMK